ncbi:uncharacterized protein PV09_06022 [Verruconis gallopava]|uniref:Septin-type G domain-containing protein n=1 Tax=Verruconis gallopava TaxID=253628 RepID=A0A0D1YPM0_9PEZI|nr:uncharacterized protein PV09_06022 [Verruconis gallopava]KIW02567.1 hypothetical protein PV09_06022 [Verruconis gallopava]
MRPTPAANEAAFPPRSRKSSLVSDRRPSLSSVQPTSFFLAREEDIFGPPRKPSSRRSSASNKSDGGTSLEASGPRLGSDGKTGPPDSMYGVQSLEEALGQAFGQDDIEDEEEKETVGAAGLLRRKRGNEAADRMSVTEDGKQHTSPQHHLPAATTAAATRSSRANTISQPLTPLQLESPIPESAMPSTPKSGSFRSLALSEEDDEAASQAITSAGEEEDGDDGEDEAGGGAEEMQHSQASAPQLVMPSLSMPSRRPFTERGKQMGRLKIAVAGASGVGKTSLIRAIVRQCEDIVHLDPIATPTPNVQTPRAGEKRSRKHRSSATTQITEIQASTKAYPLWWSDIEDSRVLLRRRKSMTETVLERNVCFIDTPGIETSSKMPVEKHALVEYLETLFQKNVAMTEMSSADLLGVLSGAGGVQVDVVLYICEPAESISQRDFEYMGRLAQFTSVIPIISKADASPETELSRRKNAVAQELLRCNINAGVLNKPRPEKTVDSTEQTDVLPEEAPLLSTEVSSSVPSAPFLVSCLPGSDDGEMDASLLMSPSYSPPLVPSELQALVAMLFDPETMAKLRHISARKFLQWRERLGLDGDARSSADSSILGPAVGATGLGIRDHLALARNGHQRRTGSPGGALITRSHTSPFNLSSTSIGSGLPDYTRARIRDHILREERLAQIQLAKWASDLQKNARREREEYARLVEGERARWLLERVGEEIAMGRISSVNEGDYSGETRSLTMRRRERKRLRDGGMELPSWARSSDVGGMMDPSDPLGLCLIGDGVRTTGNVVLKVLGGGVLVGAVWLAICRAWGIDPEKWWHPSSWW